jgi:hypothetical protein
MAEVCAAVGHNGSSARLPGNGLEPASEFCPSPLASTSTTGAIRRIADLVDLTCVFEPEVQVVWLRREPNRAIACTLDDLVRAGTLGGGFRIALPAGAPLGADGLPGLPDRSALHADIAFLLELYADLVGCSTVGLRFEVTERAMCPRFHTDRVGIRLLCTYRGPATEWLDDTWADRSKLGRGAGRLCDEASGLMCDPTRVGRAEPFDLVLLKGCAWPGNEQRGAIHRSPVVPTEATPRVLVTIDALWTGT